MNDHRQAPDNSWPAGVQQPSPATAGFNWQKPSSLQQVPTHAPGPPTKANQPAFDWSSAHRPTPTQGFRPAAQLQSPTTSAQTSQQYSSMSSPGPHSSSSGAGTPGGSQFTASGMSVRDRAIAGEQDALETLFGQFIPQGEQIVECRYMGVLGIWGIGTHSFAAITPNRAASLKMSMLGGVLYQDGPLEYVNSAAIFQPSKVGLYINVAVTMLVLGFLAITGFATWAPLGVLFIILMPLAIPLAVRLHYRLHKSGLVLWVREGIAINIFIDRMRIKQANRYYRVFCDLREERIKVTGASI